MRIAIIISEFNGGAPKSLLQYVSVLKSKGHSVFICGKGGTSNYCSEFLKLGVEVCELKYGITENGRLQKIKGVTDALYHTVKWAPDLIITVGVHLSAYVSNTVKKIGIQCLCLIPGGNLNGGKNIIKTIKSNYAVVFSRENKTQLENYGFLGTVRVISNRIPSADLHDLEIQYAKDANKELSLLIASRISEDKKKSIKTVIDFFDWFNSNNGSANLTVAGGGNCLEEIKEYAATKSASSKIRFAGQVSNIEDYYKKSDVCFGKGRSILEPLIMGRYAVCVSEDDKMKWVDENSFSDLEHYNFSGRNIGSPDSFEKIKYLIDCIHEENSISELKKAKEIAALQYGSSFLEEKFYNEFFLPNFENVKSDCKSRPSKIKLYAKVVKYWLKTRRV